MAVPAHRRPGLPVPVPALIREKGGRFLHMRRRPSLHTTLRLVYSTTGPWSRIWTAELESPAVLLPRALVKLGGGHGTRAVTITKIVSMGNLARLVECSGGTRAEVYGSKGDDDKPRRKRGVCLW